MTERLLLPPHYRDISDDALLAFLVGPVQGAPNWQDSTAESLLAKNDTLLVASPRRREIDPENFNWNEQVTWEKRHIKRAGKNGIILIWFAAQDHSLPYEKGRAYSKTTHKEQSNIFGRIAEGSWAKAVLGIDPHYTKNGGESERYVRDDCDELGIPIYDNLHELEQAALDSLT